MGTQDFKDQIRHEVSRMRDLALKSNDPLITAKAVAVSDVNVQGVMLKRLSRGERLMEVIAFPGVSQGETHVFLRFVDPSQAVQIVDSGFLVVVDRPKGEVVGTVDPYDLQPEHRPGRPFVIVSTVNPWDYRLTESDLQEAQDRVVAFFRRLAIKLRPDFPRGGGGGGDGFGAATMTVDDTIFGSETWSGGKSDDTRSDRTQDYNDR